MNHFREAFACTDYDASHSSPPKIDIRNQLHLRCTQIQMSEVVSDGEERGTTGLEPATSAVTAYVPEVIT